MRNAYVYDYAGGELTRSPVVVAGPRNINSAMEIARRDGQDETSPFVQDVIGKYVNYDPKNDLIDQWYNATGAVKDALEAADPWLAYYRGDDTVTPPADDPAPRQAEAEAVVADFHRRVFKAERAQVVSSIRATVNGKEFDGDEVAQARMARAITIAHAEMLNQLLAYLAANLSDSTITAHELLTGLHDTLAATKAALDTQWMLADNTAATVTPDELKDALHDSMLQLSANWGFNQ